MKEIFYYIAIDWGRKKVGLAIADSETKIATAYAQLSQIETIKELEKLQQERPVRGVVIGISGAGDVKYSRNDEAIRVFGEQIKNLGVDVYFEQEQFTTKMAQRNIREHGKGSLTKIDDAEAARIILQSWLDRQLG